MRKRIFFIGGNLYPNRIGGYEVFNHYLTKELDKRYQVTTVNTEKVDETTIPGIYIRLPKIKPTALFTPLLYLLYLLRLPNDGNSLVILSYSRSRWIHWWIYPLLKRISGLDYIVIIHGGSLSEWDIPIIHRKLLEHASSVVGVSLRICETYRKRVDRKYINIPPMIPFSKHPESISDCRKSLGLNENDKVFLFVGSLKKLKNPQTIIEAAELIGKPFLQKNNIRFVFAGSGSLDTELKSRVKKVGLSREFIFLGMVPRSSIPKVYKASDYYIISSDFEGTPISLLEAMFNSLIVFGSNSPGIDSIIKHNKNGYLFELKNSQQLANLIYMLINSSQSKLHHMKQEAYNYAKQNFDYELIINKYIKIIDS